MHPSRVLYIAEDSKSWAKFEKGSQRACLDPLLISISILISLSSVFTRLDKSKAYQAFAKDPSTRPKSSLTMTQKIRNLPWGEELDENSLSVSQCIIVIRCEAGNFSIGNSGGGGEDGKREFHFGECVV